MSMDFGYGEATSAARRLVGVYTSGRHMFTLGDLKDDVERTGLLILMSRGYLRQRSMGSAHGYVEFTEKFFAEALETAIASPEEPPKKSPDKNGHTWVHRRQSVCPFQCSECGALSGTDDAGHECQAKRVARFGDKALKKLLLSSDGRLQMLVADELLRRGISPDLESRSAGWTYDVGL